MRRLAALLLLAMAAACQSGPVPPPTSTPSEPTPSPPSSASPVVSPAAPASATPEPQIQLPAGTPTTFDRDLAPAQLPLGQLVPPGARVDSTWYLAPPQDPVELVGVVWSRGSDPYAQEHGFELWKPLRGSAGWRIVYAFTDPTAKGVLGIRTMTADLTGDTVPDVLTFEDTGGSGACGAWRVIATQDQGATQIFLRKTCDTQIQPVGGTLEIRTAVYRPGDAHCCPSAFRTTTLRWDGATWDVVSREITEAGG